MYKWCCYFGRSKGEGYVLKVNEKDCGGLLIFFKFLEEKNDLSYRDSRLRGLGWFLDFYQTDESKSILFKKYT